jgi:hypothetical protein
MNKIIRFSLTILLLWWAASPYLDTTNSNNALDALLKFGIWWSILFFALFFVMVAFYCKTLQECLALIKPQNRKTTPLSVWYMFLIPFNFVEDFFIVINISNSIEQEAKVNPKLADIKDFGMTTGIGWSIAQVLSFVPNYIGQIAGVLAFVLVIIHWVFIIKINRLLSNQ